MINDPFGPQDATRAPRLRVLWNNKAIPGVVSLSVTTNNYYQCDTFNLSVAASAGDPGWWDINPPMILDIQIGIDGGAWQSLLIGEVDHQQFHIQTGLLELSGRDLSARFIEAKTQEAFVNQTASQVAVTLAARHGLASSVTATNTLIGRYYEQDHSHLTMGQFSRTTTEWDLLTTLARFEGFDVFMLGTVLHFQAPPLETAEPYVLNYTPPGPVQRLNGTSLNLERSLTLAKDVQVDVRSWSSRQGRAFTKTARAIGGKAAAASGGSSGKPTTTQKYVFVRPNLNEDQAQKLANQMARDITLHERVVAAEMPGELTLTPRNMVKLQGTGTSFDQTYFIASITRSLSFSEGFRQSMRLKNSSPRTQTQV